MFGQLTHTQHLRQLSSFLAAEVDYRNDPLRDLGETVVATTLLLLAFTAEESGITNIPTAILKVMFGKATNLIAAPGDIIQKPGVNDG